jgi:hypothetical protein
VTPRCDCATSSAGDAPVVTAIAGPQLARATLGAAAYAVGDPAPLQRATQIIWAGHRSEIDLSNEAVALALGVDLSAQSQFRCQGPL